MAIIQNPMENQTTVDESDEIAFSYMWTATESLNYVWSIIINVTRTVFTGIKYLKRHNNCLSKAKERQLYFLYKLKRVTFLH